MLDRNDTSGILQKTLSVPGQGHTAGAAVKERNSQLLLQNFDLMGHGRLGHMKLRGSPREAQGICHREKACELKRIQVSSSPPGFSIDRSCFSTLHKKLSKMHCDTNGILI
jgi:hypothetical protein